MQSIVLEYKLARSGTRICSFPECKKQKDLIGYSHHQLCSDHYNYISILDQGEEPLACSVPMCCLMTNLIEYDGHILCPTHYRRIEKSVKLPVPGSCYIDTCPRNGTHEFKGKTFCSYHCQKIQERTETPKRNEHECNYIGCNEFWTVSGFNSRWCPRHYLEMCSIRESIKHDDSEIDRAARLKELKVRKDGFTETGLRHRWYYLQSVIRSLSQQKGFASEQRENSTV